MTSPVNSIKRGGSRFYVDPETGDKLPSVTAVIGTLAKPFLAPWNAKMVATAAADEFGTLAQMLSQGNREGAIDYFKGAARRSSAPASQLGSEVHDLCDRIAKGEDIKHVHPEHQGHVDLFKQWISDFNVEFYETEITVWSDTHGFAGTLDAICRIEDEVVILDYKTGKSVYSEVALQLNAYANADCILDPDGTRRELPEVEAGAVLHLRADKAELIPVRLGDDIFDVFKNLIVASEWQRETHKTVLGQPITPTQGN